MRNRLLIRALVAGLLLLFAALAFPQDRGLKDKLYVGGAIGRGSYDADFERTKSVIRTTGATSFSGSASATDTVWKSYIGYRVSPSFSFEAAYSNFGQIGFSAAVAAPVTGTLQRNYRTDGFGVSGVLWLPLNTTWSGLVKAGVLRTETKASASDPIPGLAGLSAESSRKFNTQWGVGMEYRLTPAASARIEYENVRKVGDDSKFGTADINLWTIGANYRF